MPTSATLELCSIEEEDIVGFESHTIMYVDTLNVGLALHKRFEEKK